jgi:hypothetical protein
MKSTDQDLHSLAVDEELRYKARAVLSAGRPVVAFALLGPLAIVCASFGVADSGLPISTKLLLGATLAVPSLMLEVWYLSRRLEASLILLGLSRERL